MGRGPGRGARRQLLDCPDHPLFGIGKPLGVETLQRIPADFAAQGQNLPFADSGGSHHGEEITPPLFGHPNAHLAHPHDIHVVFVIFLHLHRREDQRAFFVNVARGAVIGGRNRIADIRLMRLGSDRIAVHTVIVDDRDQDRVIGRMRAAVIGRIVKKSVTTFEVGMKLFHRLAHHVRARQHMDRQAFRHRGQLVIRGQDAAREVPRNIEHTRASGAHKRVAHFP
jgi:hypothetical protein